LTCFKCQGPYHPATGWFFMPGVVYCGRCAREFGAWYKARMRQMSARKLKLGGAFTAAACTSVRPA